jgi:hypothetical protein
MLLPFMKIPHLTYLAHVTNPFLIALKCILSKEIEDIIKSLKTKASYGYDEISTRILEVSSLYISSPFNILVQSNAGNLYFHKD